jgi:argininosuccinate lyase
MEREQKTSSLWGCGGRFSQSMNVDLTQLNNSLQVDKRLYAEDISGSIAYMEALCHAKIIQASEVEIIRSALQIIRREWESGEMILKDDDEDIHSVNERRLIEIVGDVGRKIHTGRSRNDQVALDMKMWMKNSISVMMEIFKNLFSIIITKAEDNIEVLMPGYTHLQVNMHKFHPSPSIFMKFYRSARKQFVLVIGFYPTVSSYKPIAND